MNFIKTMTFLSVISINLVFAAGGDHQVGEKWGKEEIHIGSLTSHPFLKNNPKAQKIAKATAWLTHPFHGAWHTREPMTELPNAEGKPVEDIISQFYYMGTAHLLGEFDGKLMMQTNSHLIHEKVCHDISIQFVFLPGKPRVECVEVVIRDEELDYALIEVTPKGIDQAEKKEIYSLLKNNGVNLDYDA